MPNEPNAAPRTLPGTKPLTRTDDLARAQIDAMDAYMDKLVVQAVQARRRAGAESRNSRERFRTLLTLTERRNRPRPSKESLSATERFRVSRLRWPVGDGLTVAVLCLEPRRHGAKPAAVVIPDENQLPEDLAGLTDALAPQQQVARILAEAGAVVLCPYLVPREYVGRSLGEPGDYLNWRRRLWKLATQVGRTLIGFEVDRVLSCIDLLNARSSIDPNRIFVGGQGQGGLTALYAAAADERIAGAAFIDYAPTDADGWQEPVDRALWGLLREFDGGEIQALVYPRRIVPIATTEKGGITAAWEALLGLPLSLDTIQSRGHALDHSGPAVRVRDDDIDEQYGCPPTQQRDEIETCCLRLATRSAGERRKRWAEADCASIEAYKRTVEPRRRALADMIGLPLFPEPDAPMSAHSRLIYDLPEFHSYEVTLPVYKDVFLYGVLSIPADLVRGERRPTIVCHHGAGGHCRYDVVGIEPTEKSAIYHSIGSEHARRGYVTFAPQGHFGVDAIRGTLQDLYRKAFSVGATDFGLFVRMHQRLAEWLCSLRFVDVDRIGFHGLSYGGYTALWVPPFVPQYRAVVCAGHFNDWCKKTTAPEHPTCYLWHNDDQMYNFNLLNEFNHSDLTALICPRPFMVEAGLADAVTPPEWANPEYAKVKRLYAKLGIPERTEIHWGDGGHQIFAERSYPFLDRWLND